MYIKCDNNNILFSIEGDVETEKAERKTEILIENRLHCINAVLNLYPELTIIIIKQSIGISL